MCVCVCLLSVFWLQVMMSFIFYSNFNDLRVYRKFSIVTRVYFVLLARYIFSALALFFALPVHLYFSLSKATSSVYKMAIGTFVWLAKHRFFSVREFEGFPAENLSHDSMYITKWQNISKTRSASHNVFECRNKCGEKEKGRKNINWFWSIGLSVCLAEWRGNGND